MPPTPRPPLRIARPTRALAAAERFWVDGLGLEVLFRSAPDAGGHALLMVGWPDASWHLELVDDPASAQANPPGEEDLLVLYLDDAVDPDLLDRLTAAGGTPVPARNPYWDVWGVTVQDPDGHRLVLCTRSWPTNQPGRRSEHLR